MFFGMIRSAGGCNDSPNVPTFLQLYKILSLFGILRPPRKGNCTFVDGQQSHKRIIEFVDLKKIYKAPSQDLLAKLSKNLKVAITDEEWQLQDITTGTEGDSTLPEATVIENIIYYSAGICIFVLYMRVQMVLCYVQI